MKKHAALPDALRYLRPFAGYLEKLPPDCLDESVDAVRLEKALRKRIDGLAHAAACKKLRKDRAALKTWLKSSERSQHPAHWILGYLTAPDKVAKSLLLPAKPPPNMPTIVFQAPHGWKSKAVYGRLDLKVGKVFASIVPVDSLDISIRRAQFAHASRVSASPFAASGTREAKWGEVFGLKATFAVHEPTPWKRVEYLLTVPGGHASVGVASLDGADFDESPIESKLHTLRVQAPIVRPVRVAGAR